MSAKCQPTHPPTNQPLNRLPSPSHFDLGGSARFLALLPAKPSLPTLVDSTSFPPPLHFSLHFITPYLLQLQHQLLREPLLELTRELDLTLSPSGIALDGHGSGPRLDAFKLEVENGSARARGDLPSRSGILPSSKISPCVCEIERVVEVWSARFLAISNTIS